MPSRKVIDEFCIIDFDRTLARTDDFRELYEGVIETLTPITVAEIHQARNRIKSNFDVTRYVRKQLQNDMPPSQIDEAMGRARRTFLEKARMQDLLEPHAHELLEYLQARNLAHGILTSGGKEWQQTKIEAARLEYIPHMIINTTEKGPLVASWQQSDGTFLLPDELTGEERLYAHEVIFLDDKTISFQGIPPTVRAFRIVSVTAKEPYEPELSLPANVKEVRGLYGAMEYIRNRDAPHSQFPIPIS